MSRAQRDLFGDPHVSVSVPPFMCSLVCVGPQGQNNNLMTYLFFPFHLQEGGAGGADALFAAAAQSAGEAGYADIS